ncbi:HAMP domain-containing protein, partial [bacterium]|nr:HAMP domain-containing protein [bacterium]
MKIVNKVSLSILLLLGVSSLIVGAISYNSFRSIRMEMYKWFDRNGQTLSESIGNKALEHLNYYDFDSVEQTLKQEVDRDEDLIYGKIQFDANFSEVRDFGDPEFPAIRKYTHDVVDEDSIVAKVTIHYSTKVVDRKLSSLIVYTAIGAGLTLIALLAALYALMVVLVNRPLLKLVNAVRQIADGNLLTAVETGTADEFGELATTFNLMTGRLKEVVSHVKTASLSVTSASQAMRSNTGNMSQGATEQAAAAEEASSSMEEMSSNIRQNAENAQQTEKIAVKAAETAS